MLLKSLVALLAAAATASAAALPILPREECAYQCSSVCYYQRTIDAAVAKGYQLHQSNSDINDYPHEYQNREGFDFPTQGPWYEYPIMRDYDVYDGGSPGADRVVFNGDGEFTAVISHEGESNNGFGECEA